jgi:hypothetical protein
MFQAGGTARILFTHPPTKVKRWTDDDLPDAAKDWLSAIVAELFAMQPHIDIVGARTPLALPLAPDARLFWVDWYNEHAEKIAAADAFMSAALSKLEAYGARLSLIFQLVHHVTTSAKGDQVELESIRRGTTLTEWFIGETIRVYETLGESESSRTVRRLIDYIRAKGGEISLRNYRRWKHLDGADGEAKAVIDLQALVDGGYAAWAWEQGAGRPSKVLRLVGAGDKSRRGHSNNAAGDKSPDDQWDPPDIELESGVSSLLAPSHRENMGTGGPR